MIEQLINPKTNNFHQLKELVLSFNFAWHWNSVSVFDPIDDPIGDSKYENFGYYSHCFLGSPGGYPGKPLHSIPSSSFLSLAHDVTLEILHHNNVQPQVIYRLHANCVHPTKTNKPGFPHTDHSFPHKNLIVYLTDTYGGDTIVEEKTFSGKEDEVILFSGEHYHYPPVEERRIVLVSTFL